MNCDSLDLPADFSSFGGSDLLCDPNSLQDLRRVVDYQFVQLFTCC